MSIFEEKFTSITEVEAEQVKSSSHYEQEADPVDTDEALANEPLTDLELESITSRPSNSDNPFAGVEFDVSPPPGEYVPYQLRQKRRREAMMPPTQPLTDASADLAKITSLPGVPEEVEVAVAEARDLIAEAHQILDQARHPDLPRQPRNQQAKAKAIEATEAAVASARRAVARARTEEMVAQQREAIVSQLLPAKERAATALNEATQAYTEWRNLIDAAHELAIESGDFGASWHDHPERLSVNARGLIGDLRRARDLARGEDPYFSGEYLVDDPTPEGELPAWTAASLAKMPRDSFGWSVLARISIKHQADGPVREALATKSLAPIYDQPIPVLSPSAREWEAALAPHRG